MELNANQLQIAIAELALDDLIRVNDDVSINRRNDGYDIRFKKALRKAGVALGDVLGVMEESLHESIAEKLHRDMKDKEYIEFQVGAHNDSFVIQRHGEHFSTRERVQDPIHAVGGVMDAVKELFSVSRGMFSSQDQWREPFENRPTLREFLSQYQNIDTSAIKSPFMELKLLKHRYRKDGDMELNVVGPGMDTLIKLHVERDAALNPVKANLNPVLTYGGQEAPPVPALAKEIGNVPFAQLYADSSGKLFYSNVSKGTIELLQRNGIPFAGTEKGDGTFNVAYEEHQHFKVDRIRQAGRPKEPGALTRNIAR